MTEREVFMTTRVEKLVVILPFAVATVLVLPPLSPSRSDERKVDVTAVAIAKEWRFPGVNTVELGIQPRQSQAFCLERYTVQAKFEDVWNHYGAKCSLKDKYRDNFRHAVMQEMKEPDKGHNMILDVAPGRETHFGQNTDRKTVHVEIRKADESHTEVCTVVGTR
jgi:hypothetical protein